MADGDRDAGGAGRRGRGARLVAARPGRCTSQPADDQADRDKRRREFQQHSRFHSGYQLLGARPRGTIRTSWSLDGDTQSAVRQCPRMASLTHTIARDAVSCLPRWAASLSCRRGAFGGGGREPGAGYRASHDKPDRLGRRGESRPGACDRVRSDHVVWIGWLVSASPGWPALRGRLRLPASARRADAGCLPETVAALRAAQRAAAEPQPGARFVARHGRARHSLVGGRAAASVLAIALRQPFGLTMDPATPSRRC